MKKTIILLFITLVSAAGYTQNKFDLTPSNMINYIGKITQPEFEKLVGEPIDFEPIDDKSNFTIYEVENTYDKIITAIRCYFRESDGKLISMKFPTPHYLGYWIDFSEFKGYTEKDNFKSWTNKFNQIYQTSHWCGSFGMQILDIQTRPGGTSNAIINYHIRK